jgi:hypothetical protein
MYKKFDVTKKAVEVLQENFRKNWVNSIELIYTFAKKYTKDSLEDVLTEYGKSSTAKSNAFTAAAKLAVMHKTASGEWEACHSQVSRYSKICQYLHTNGVAVDDVEEALKGKSLNSILSSTKKRPSLKELDDQLSSGLFELTNDFENVVVEDDVVNIKALDVRPGVNLMVVVTDDDGNIVSMTVAAGKQKYDEIAEEIIRSKAKYNNAPEDAVSEAIELKRAA